MIFECMLIYGYLMEGAGAIGEEKEGGGAALKGGGGGGGGGGGKERLKLKSSAHCN